MAELNQVQEETEAILDQVVQFRQSFPGKTADKLSSELATLQLSLVGDNIDVNVVEQNDDICVGEDLLGRLSNGVEKSIGLQQELPRTIAKLERARTVLTEEGKKRMSANSTNKPTGQWALAVGGSVGEATPSDFNDMLTKYRRTSHQFYLAHNLSAASHFN